MRRQTLLPWFSVKIIDDRTFSIGEYGHWEKVHSFLLIGQERAALIDTGTGIDDISSVIAELTDLPVMVITTHCHWDHIGGHQYYPEIAVHSADREWLEQGIPRTLEEMRGTLLKEPFVNPPPAHFSIKDWVPFTGTPSVILKDEDTIDLGGRQLRVLHTPGHSPGHVCLLDKRTGYLITGDLVYKGTLFASYESTDPLAYQDSVKRIASLSGVTMLLTAHNQPTLEPEYLQQVVNAFRMIQDNDELRHGTGIHSFGDLHIHL